MHSYQVWRHSTTFKAQAEAAWNANPRRLVDAIQMMRAYLRLEPRDYEAREELGFWYLSSGAFSAASTTLEELMRTLEKQNPPDVPAIQRVRRKLVDTALAQGRCADAAFHLELLREELPDDVDILNRLGKCKVTLGREEDAIQNFSEAIRLKPERVDIYYNKAMALRFSSVPKLPQAEKCMAEMVAYWDDPNRRKRTTPSRPRAPRLRHVARGTGKERRGLEAGRDHPVLEEGRPGRALSGRAVGAGLARFS